MLEQHNPDVQFDWTRILKQPAVVEPAPPQSQKPSQRPRRQERPLRERSPDEDRTPRERGPEPVPQNVTVPLVEELARDDVADIEAQIGVEAELADEPAGMLVDEANVARVAGRVGAEGLARLRARYAEVMARIADKPLDEPARDELKSRAERLNPDAWVTDDEVREGLEQYETVFESLRPMLGHPRRRRRRRG